MKKILLTLGIIFLSSSAIANESMLTNCNKNYPISADNLYMLTLSALNSQGQYEVVEMQSKSGYIMFLAANKKSYVATISKEGTTSSNIKILPANSDFSNGTAIQKAVFDLIDLNIKNIPQKVL